MLSAVVGLFAWGIAEAEPFHNPPELTQPEWVTPFPYQRNILVGFDTDPHQWPDHISSPVPDARKALTPHVVHHEGNDDPVLYPSDWVGGQVEPSTDGQTGWLATDTLTGTDREGILVFEGVANTQLTLVWNIDNWDRQSDVKHFFVEAEYYTTGNDGLDELLSSTGQLEVLADHSVTLADGWTRWWSWAALTPNPEWEQMVNTVTLTEDGYLLMDYMHIATECVPEPATLALVGLGLAGLAARRRRRRDGGGASS
jgi:hypothetical protein